MMIDIEGQVAGLYKIEAFRADAAGNEIPGTRRVAADWFPNLVTNNGLNLIGSASNWLSFCQVGSGSSPASHSDTALASRIAATGARVTSVQGAQAEPPYFAWRRNTYRFNEGVAAGNIAEVGVGPATSGNLFSRALVLDGSGNPTAISVAANESLDVSYELRYDPPATDLTFTLELAGITHTVTSRAANVTTTNAYGWSIREAGSEATIAGSTSRAFSGTIGPITGSPTGSLSSPPSASDAAYSAGSYRRDGTATWVLANGNFPGGIGAIRISHGIGNYQFGFSPPIMKDATKVLALTFRHSWARRP